MTEPCLVLDRVSLRYGAVTALDEVSISVGRGERVALLGPSGAGKSSLIALASTACRPSAGTVHLFGRSLTGLSSRDRQMLRRRLALVDQQPPLPGSLRVVHNVNAGRLGHWSTWRALSSLVRPRDLRRAERALETLGIGDKLWRRTDELSGGERQRVALARIIVQGADLVLADEPVANLDPARADEVLSLLCAGAGDAQVPAFETVVVSLHDVGLARHHFGRVIGLRHGRVLFDGPAADVTPGVVNALYAIGADV